MTDGGVVGWAGATVLYRPGLQCVMYSEDFQLGYSEFTNTHLDYMVQFMLEMLKGGAHVDIL